MVGGLLLFWIAVKLLIADEPDDDSVASSSNLWEAVKIVAIADVVMSLDNVLAIAAAAMQAPAEQQIWLIVLGLLISIPFVIARIDPDMFAVDALPRAGVGRRGAAWLDRRGTAGHRRGLGDAGADLESGFSGRRSRVGGGAAAGGLILYSAATIGALIVLLAGWVLLRRRRRGAVGVPGQEGGPADRAPSPGRFTGAAPAGCR